MRVVPLADGLCPSCRTFNFNAGPSDEETVEAARRLARKQLDRRLRRAAVLHWRLVGWFGAAVILTVGRVYVRHEGVEWLGEPQLDKEWVANALTAGAIVAVGIMWRTAVALSKAIELASNGRRVPQVLTVLRESMGFFEENGVPTLFVGPRMSGLGDGDS
jgi:hypothetical protein